MHCPALKQGHLDKNIGFVFSYQGPDTEGLFIFRGTAFGLTGHFVSHESLDFRN